MAPVVLPPAPPVVRAVGAPVRWRRAPAVALVVVGVLLVLGPIVGGLFSKVAAGAQMIDRFEPHLTEDSLARYDADLGLLRRGATGVGDLALAPGQYPLLDGYQAAAPAIDQRATSLLAQIRAAEPDYRRVADVGGFDRIPFLLVVAGVAAVYGGAVLLGRQRGRARSAIGLVVLAGAFVAVYPFVSSLVDGSRAGDRMVDDLAPIMTPEQVSQLQSDFVVLVQAVGQLDTQFKGRHGDIDALVAGWPGVSSDLAELVGTINDDIGNYRALDDLDGLVPGGLSAFPWLLAGVGVVVAVLAVAARPLEVRP